jgi:hypothetical protein
MYAILADAADRAIGGHGDGVPAQGGGIGYQQLPVVITPLQGGGRHGGRVAEGRDFQFDQGVTAGCPHGCGEGF